MFAQIWEDREHVSEISERPLGDEANVWFFAHILPKGAYGRFRLREDNIVLMTQDEHYMFDHQTHKAKEDPRFDGVFKKAEELKREYHAL